MGSLVGLVLRFHSDVTSSRHVVVTFISLIYLMRVAITSCELVLTKFNRICDVYYYCGVVLSSCNQDTLSCYVVLSLCNVVTSLCGPLLSS